MGEFTCKTGNALLDRLGPTFLAEVGPQLHPCELVLRDVLLRRGQAVDRVYFVTSGMVSVVTTMADGGSVETHAVGPEGVAGVPAALGAARAVTGDFVVQVRGGALSMETGAFRDLVRSDADVRELVDRYTNAAFAMAAQSGACNRLHSVMSRASKWLLMTRDRVGSDSFRLTHDFLAEMIGVRRASVSEAAEDLRERGAIDYRRGEVTIADRSRLEAAACECYEVIRSLFTGLYD